METKVTNIPSNVTIRTAELPDGVHGVITALEAGRYLIILSADDSEEQQQRTLRHELRHYYNGDHDKAGTVNEIEYNTHVQEGRLNNGKE